jgi:hypothetical protein
MEEVIKLKVKRLLRAHRPQTKDFFGRTDIVEDITLVNTSK